MCCDCKGPQRDFSLLKGVLDAQNASSVTIVDSLGIGLETNVNTIINNLTIDTTLSNAVNAHNIKVTAGNLTLTGDTKLGQSNSNSFRVEAGASAELSGTVSIGGTDSNNSLVINGAVTLAEDTKLSVSGSKNNGIYFENGLGSFVAETGDVSRFEDAKAIQKLSGLAIVSDDSGKHNGQSSISYRGRKHLRYTMYLGAISVICHNDQFAEIYSYYRERKNNPLKKLQAVIAVACKMIRVFYAILTKGISYDGARMSADIKRLAVQPV